MSDQRTRNTGIVPASVAGITSGQTVAIAGLGGVGGLTASMLVRQVKLAGLNISDLDTFDGTNLNRQHGAYHSTIGIDKVKASAQEIADLDPNVVVREFPRGISLDNIDDFLRAADGSPVDMLLNAVDYTKPEIFLALTRRATDLGIPIIVGAEVAYGTRVVWFKPGGMTYEQYFQLEDGQPLDLVRLIMRVPAHADVNALRAVLRGEIEAPAIAVGGLQTAGVLVTWIEAILSGVLVPRPAPYAFQSDLRERKSGYIRFSRVAFTLSALRAALRCRLGLNPPAI
jgi:hypothetical protein